MQKSEGSHNNELLHFQLQTVRAQTWLMKTPQHFIYELFCPCASPPPHPSTPPFPFNERDYEITGILKLPITTAPGCFIKTKSHHSRTQQCAVAYFSCRVHLPPKDKEKATDENHLHFQARFRGEKMNTKRPNFPRRSSSYPHSHPGSFPRKALQE